MSSVTDVDELLLSKDKSGRNLLHLAAEYGSAEEMRDLLNLLPPHIVKEMLVMRDNDGTTSLLVAVSANGCHKVLLMLVEFVLDSSNTFG